MRDYVKRRDVLTCQRCGTTDPLKPESKSGLRLLCIPCHNAVGYEQRGTEKLEAPLDLFDSLEYSV